MNAFLKVLVIVSPFFFTACGQNEPQTLRTLSEGIVLKIQEGALNDAFQMIQVNWPLSQTEVDTLKAHTLENRKKLIERYGEPIEIEYIRCQKIGNSFLQLTFLEKFEKHAIKWEFGFYKPHNKWLMNSMYWDDKINTLYQER